MNNINYITSHTLWWTTSLGKEVIRAERFRCHKLLPQQYYRVAMQISQFPQFHYLDAITSEIKCQVSTWDSGDLKCDVVAEGEWLPFAAKSIDLLVLPHVLEFSYAPHDVFREISECIVPEGVVVIIGFNPKSILGFMKYCNRYRSMTLHQAKFLSSLRVRDWLSLLGFESIACEMVFFQPPSMSNRHRKSRQFLENAGSRLWSGFGSVYVLVARKKEMAVRLNRSKIFQRHLKKKHAVLQPVVERSIDGSNSKN